MPAFMATSSCCESSIFCHFLAQVHLSSAIKWQQPIEKSNESHTSYTVKIDFPMCMLSINTEYCMLIYFDASNIF